MSRDKEAKSFIDKKGNKRSYFPIILKGESVKEYYDNVLKRAIKLANEVSPNTANNSYIKRNRETVLGNCLAGVISEDAWKIFFNDYSFDKKYVSEQAFDVNKFKRTGTQIDLETINTKKTIEVRSSFIKQNPIEKSLNHLNIIGAYKNNYKIDEVFKDYHVLALFKGDPSGLIYKIKNYEEINLFLAGGVTKEMLINNSKIGSLSNKNTISKTHYTLIPIVDSIDPLNIKKSIKEAEKTF